MGHEKGTLRLTLVIHEDEDPEIFTDLSAREGTKRTRRLASLVRRGAISHGLIRDKTTEYSKPSPEGGATTATTTAKPAQSSAPEAQPRQGEGGGFELDFGLVPGESLGMGRLSG